MKLYPYSLVGTMALVLVLMGCGTEPSTPVAATSGTTAAPVRVDSHSKKRDTFEEQYGRAPIVGPLEPTNDPPAQATVSAPPGSDANPPINSVSDSAGTRPKADREPTKPGDPEKITFDDLILGMEKDMVYRPFMLTERAKELEGKKVRISGEMYPGSVSGTRKLKEFILLRNSKCLYGKGGQADHVADVKMKEGHTIDYSAGTVRVEGTLRIVPANSDEDGTTKHIYVLEDAVGR